MIQPQPKRAGVLHRWAEIEFGVSTIVVVALITIAWFNDRHSLGRLLLMVFSWAILALCIIYGRRLSRTRRV